MERFGKYVLDGSADSLNAADRFTGPIAAIFKLAVISKLTVISVNASVREQVGMNFLYHG